MKLDRATVLAMMPGMQVIDKGLDLAIQAIKDVQVMIKVFIEKTESDLKGKEDSTQHVNTDEPSN